MTEAGLKEELASLRRRYEAAVARAGEADRVVSAIGALLGADQPDRIAETVFDSFRALTAFDSGCVLTLDGEGGVHCRFATHAVRATPSAASDGLVRVAEGAACAVPDARKVPDLAPFLPAGSDTPLSALLFPFSTRGGRGLVLFVREGFGLYQAEEAARLRKFSVVAAQGLAALEEIRLEREYDRTARAQAIAQAANEAKSRFLERVSHELRTPLNGVLGSVEVLKMQALPQLCERSIQDIEACGQQMLKLVSDVIDYAGEDGLSDRSDIAPLSDLTASAVRRHRVGALAKHLKIGVQVDPRLAGLRLAGAASVRRILDILVDNAVKYTEAGSVTLACGPLGGGVEITVTDTGVGMSAQLARSVFEPFLRGDASRTTSVDGLGIGLPLAKKLVRELGGTLTLQTAPGAGVTARLELPASLCRPAEPAPAPETVPKRA